MKLKSIIEKINSEYPFSIQENYDNSGLQIGFLQNTISNILVCFEINEEVVKESIKKKCQLIITHHPLIFSPIKNLITKDHKSKLIINLIKNSISVLSLHTNLDNHRFGVSYVLAKKLNLNSIKILQPKQNLLKKLVFFCPIKKSDYVLNKILDVGAGKIGDYSECSFSSLGEGSFKGLENSNQHVGEKYIRHIEKEKKIEVVFENYLEKKIIHELLKTHPYEEPAYEIYSLKNSHNYFGSGVYGTLEQSEEKDSFIKKIKKELSLKTIKTNKTKIEKIKKIALCGGSGAFLINSAKQKKCDIFISGDIKYHDFENSPNMVIADIGHYESEIHTKLLLVDILKKINNNFALFLSEKDTNPIEYY